MNLLEEHHKDPANKVNLKPNKTWHFVINNYTQSDIDWCNNISGDVNRITVSKEVGEECGTPHLQGRITFKTTQRLSALKKLHGRANWSSEIKRDSAIYCLKVDGELLMDVKNTKQGERTDLQKAVDSVRTGMSVNNLWREHPEVMVKYARGINQLHSQLNPEITRGKFSLEDFAPWVPITDFSRCPILFGAPNCGKTQFALAHFSNPLLCSDPDDLQKFVPEVHDGIVFDDMSFKHWPVNCQIHLTDWDLPRSIRNRYVNAHIPAGTRKIFTTNERDIFNFDPNLGVARRVHFMEMTPRC